VLLNTGPGNSYINAGNVGIGNTVPGAKLEVTGQVKITGGTPAAGQVLTSDAAGLATWEPVSAGMGGSGTASYIPKFFGATTLANSIIYNDGANVGIGTTSPDNNLDVEGANSGVIRVTKTGGSYSYFAQGGFGGQLVLNDTVGGTKIFLSAGQASYFLNGNVGIGTTSPDALLDVENATGATIRVTNTDASYSYLYQGDSGGSLLLQNAAGTAFVALNSYGSSYLTGGNLGIGNTSPSSPLSIGGSGNSSYNIYSGTAAGYGIYATSGTGYGVYGRVTGASGVGVLGYADIGGTGVYAYAQGAGYALRAINSSSGYAVYCDATTANKCGGNQAWYNASDRKLKENIQPIMNALYKVTNLQGVTYNMKNDPTKTPQMGFIAQDVLPYAPEVVSYDTENDYWGMQSSQLTALLVEAVKELKAENESLKARIEVLEESQ